MKIILLFACILFFCCTTNYAVVQYLTTPYEQNNPDPQTNRYDFIIVGGGLTGIILATRLAQHSRNFSVLLLEAGPHPNINTSIPIYEDEPLIHSETNWEFVSVPQKRAKSGSKDGRVPIGQGKELGGSSSHNGMIMSRGHPADYDNWAELLQDSSWSYNSLLPFFKRHENYEGSFPKSSQHGYDGPIEVTEQSYSPLEKEWVATGASLGFNYTDPNTSEQSSGFWRPQVNIGALDGKRSSVYGRYLLPNLDRPNFSVLTNAYVLKVNLDSTNTAKSVTFIRHWQKITVTASKEIILCAGALKSPHILMLSGIGAQNQLVQAGIGHRVHLPGVGATLWDHPSVVVGPFVSNTTGSTFIPGRDLTPEAIATYLATSRGPLASSLWSGYGLWSTVGNHSRPNVIFQQWAQGGGSVERVRLRMRKPNKVSEVDGMDSVRIFAALGSPRSSGSVRLGSGDPFEQPLIDFNFFTDPDDQDFQDLVKATKFIVDFYEKSEFYAKYGIQFWNSHISACSIYEFKSEDYYKCYVENISGPGIHLTSTCKMGSDQDPLAVLDSRLKVRGVKRLRVADASVMPVLINTNIQVACMMIGEKAADLIIKDWVK